MESLIRDGMKLMFHLKFIRVEHDAPEDEGDFPLIRIIVEQDGQEKVRSNDLCSCVQSGCRDVWGDAYFVRWGCLVATRRPGDTVSRIACVLWRPSRRPCYSFRYVNP